MTVGKLTSFIMYANNMQRALSKLSILFGQYSKASGAGTRILQLLHTKPEIPVQGGVIPINRTNFWVDPNFSDKIRRDTRGEGVAEEEGGEFGSVDFKGVSFRYPSRPESEVLHKFELDLRAGTVTALVGMSGSGKSTIASLLQRFYDPTEGTIFVNGIDLKILDPTWWRRGIGVVGQEPVLFSCSIAENIRYGNPDATMEEVQQAAKLANCEEFISSFENGYDTLVGERGAQISGGQKQRIAIARAILRDPHILILDEATSALDAKSEEMVQVALDALMENRTVLVIAHRLSTVKKADNIVVMESGKVLERGNHEELVKKQGKYAELVKSQLSKNTEETVLFSTTTKKSKKDKESKKEKKKELRKKEKEEKKEEKKIRRREEKEQRREERRETKREERRG
uniref:ABC transporter domain-containing protein n=1 Tax=Paramoeba aestuarina TaxID=180227 RepID=A0A7S4JJK5_9EUKA